MRDLKKNQIEVYYSLYAGSEIQDEWGNTIKGYGKPQSLRISVSSNKGEVDYQTFGTSLSYDRVMSTSRVDLPIDEQTRVWIGISPTKPHNYIVTKVARDLNSTLYAIKQVNVSEENHSES